MYLRANRADRFSSRSKHYVRDPVSQPRRKSVRVGRHFYMQKEKLDGTTIEAS